MTCDKGKPLSPVTRHLHFAVDELKPCHFRQVDNHGRILCNVIKGGDREVSVNLCRACPVSQINCQHLRAGLEKKVSTPLTVRFATGRVEVWDDSPPTIEFKQAACAAKTMPITSPRDCAGCPIRMPNVVPQNAIQVAHRSRPSAVPAAQTVAVSQDKQVIARANAARRATRTTPRIAQPTAQVQAQIVAEPQTAAAVRAPTPPPTIDAGAAADLIARAKATAERKAQEKQQRELERIAREEQEKFQAQQAQPEGKPKIIQMKEWLAGQMQKKQNANANSPYKPQAVQADAEGVSDIVYAPLGAQMATAYQETIDYERCVGWTD